MRQFPFGGLTLVGYYGYDNLGDDLLLLSSLTLLEEIEFSGPVFLPAATPVEKVSGRFPEKLDIRIIKRFDPRELAMAIGRSVMTVFGGGNLLQDCTSWRSFIYYYGLARYTLRKGKPLLFLSQGFGPVEHRSNKKALDRILSNPLTSGVMRDDCSFQHFYSLSKNVHPGTDYGPYYLFKKEILPKRRRSETGLAVIVLKNGTKVDDVLKALKLNNMTAVCAIGFHNHHDEEKRRELEEKARVNGFKIYKTSTDMEGVIDIFNSAQLIITERLHGAILAISMGIPFVWRKNSKLDSFVKSLDGRCDLNFEDGCEGLTIAINNSLKYSVDLKGEYLSRLNETVETSKGIMRKIIDRG